MDIKVFVYNNLILSFPLYENLKNEYMYIHLGYVYIYIGYLVLAISKVGHFEIPLSLFTFYMLILYL